MHAPDLTGVWANILSETGSDLQPERGPFFQPWAEAKWKANKDDDPGQPSITNGRVDLDPTVASCFSDQYAPPHMTEVFPFEILQVRDRVLILFERDCAVSHIRTDGRKLSRGSRIPPYMGYSVGNGTGTPSKSTRSVLKRHHLARRAGHPHSDALHVVGRMRRVNHDSLQIDWTFDDPKALTKPWTGRTFWAYHRIWTLPRISSPARTICTGESR